MIHEKKIKENRRGRTQQTRRNQDGWAELVGEEKKKERTVFEGCTQTIVSHCTQEFFNGYTTHKEIEKMGIRENLV